MFFICWAPFHAQRLLYVYAQEADYYSDLNEWLYILSGCLYYFSTTVNPILYNVMSVRYRRAFKQTICCGRRRREHSSREAHERSVRYETVGGSLHRREYLRELRREIVSLQKQINVRR